MDFMIVLCSLDGLFVRVCGKAGVTVSEATSIS